MTSTPISDSRLLSLMEPFYRFIFPALCVVCEASLSRDERKVCSGCRAAIRPVRRDDPLFAETFHRLSENGAVDDLVSVFIFDDQGPLQSIIHQLKYSGMHSLGVELGMLLGERLGESLPGERIDALVPIPLHMSKLRERGYNQSEYICKGILRTYEQAPLTRILGRKRYTESQTHLNIDQRRMNVSGAFELSATSRALDGWTVVLVDDVITTGATTAECARVLKDHGVQKVIASSVALAP